MNTMAFDDIVITIDDYAVIPMDRSAYLAEADLRTLRTTPISLDAQGGAGLRLQDGFLDVGHACDQTHFADVYLLRALLDKATASVGVGVGEPSCSSCARLKPYEISLSGSMRI